MASNPTPRLPSPANTTGARKAVLLSMSALVAIAVYRSKSPENDVDVFRRVWGAGVLGVMLSLAADVAPTVAGPFAVLVVLGSLTHGGDKAITNALSGLSGGASSPAGGSGTAPKGTPAGAAPAGGGAGAGVTRGGGSPVAPGAAPIPNAKVGVPPPVSQQPATAGTRPTYSPLSNG